jgi:uncharacterized protein with HEPN domain
LTPDQNERFLELCGHIVEWGERVAALVRDMSFDAFVENETAHLAAWKCVEVLGEAASNILKLDPALDQELPHLQLRSAYGMRNRLTHGYTDVDLVVLWGTIQNFVPTMVTAARDIVAKGK